LTEFLGANVLSLFAETAAIFIKLLRNARDSDISVRVEVTSALSRALKGAGKAANDATLKDIVKYAKYAINDKSQPVRSAGAEVRKEQVLPYLLMCFYKVAGNDVSIYCTSEAVKTGRI
jgi:hypothetical protein